LADELLEELLRSPLDKPTRSRRRDAEETIRTDGAGEAGTDRARLPVTPLLVGAAAVLGAVIVLAGYAIGSEDPAPTTTVATTTTTVAPADLGAPGGLPADYVAVGDRLGMRVERILVRSDGVFVTVTTVVNNSLDPELSTGFQGGVWTLVTTDGRRVTSTDESFDPLARGTVSVRFPPEGIVAEDIVSIEVNGAADRLTTLVDVDVSDPVTLEEGSAVELVPDEDRLAIDGEVTLVIDELTLTPTEGLLRWSIDTGILSNAAVEPLLTLVAEDGTMVNLATRVQTSGFTFFHPSVPTAALSSSGEHAFDPPDPEPLDPGPWTATLSLQVTWAVYQPVVAILPVEGVPVAVVEP